VHGPPKPKVPRETALRETRGEDPEDVESTLISDYIDTYGSRPFANRKVGRRMKLGSAQTIS
jgi:hypothetical protein